MARTALTLLLAIAVTGCASTTDELADALAERMSAESGRLTATGYADIDAQYGNPSQQRVLAIRASKIDAYRALSEQIYGLYVTGTTTVGDLVKRHHSFPRRRHHLRGGGRQYQPISDTTYEVTLSLPQLVVTISRNCTCAASTEADDSGDLE